MAAKLGAAMPRVLGVTAARPTVAMATGVAVAASPRVKPKLATPIAAQPKPAMVALVVTAAQGQPQEKVDPVPCLPPCPHAAANRMAQPQQVLPPARVVTVAVRLLQTAVARPAEGQVAKPQVAMAQQVAAARQALPVRAVALEWRWRATPQRMPETALLAATVEPLASLQACLTCPTT